MKTLIQIRYSKELLLLSVFVIFNTCWSPELMGQNPEIAPLNPEFVKYQSRLNKVKLMKAYDVHGKGLIPEPFLPNFVKTAPKLLKSMLPSQYDLRTAGPGGTSLLTSVKDQGECGACWAFATMGVIEGYGRKTGKGEYDLSENNLKECHGFEAFPCEGGNASKASAYLARRSGPVAETTDPYSQEAVGCKEIVFPEFWVSDIRYLPNDANIIKQNILDYGALYTTFFWDNSNYDSTNYTYYYGGESVTNHAVILVGWDDSKVTSGGTGAWIIKNSWGTLWGESGFFYISYNDTRVNSNVMFIKTINSTNINSYQFGYDKLGMLNTLGKNSNIGYGLIRFSPEGRSYTLKKLSTFVSSGPATVRFEVYDDFDGTILTNLMGSIADKTCDLPGYYTFDLPTPITVTSNNDFYIKVYYNTVGYNYPIPIEHASFGYADPVIESGKCWTSFNDTTWMAVGSDKEWKLDLCIKAYGDYFSNAPTMPASNFSATNITFTSMSINFTRGNGTGIIVVAREGKQPDLDPTDGNTYTANPVFKSGQQIGNGNYVVYNGADTSINITGLSSGNHYYFSIYEYNATDHSYRVPALSGNASTECEGYSLPFTEGFEGGVIPNCWTQAAVSPKWQFIVGDGSLGSEAHGGAYNACLKDNSSTSNRNKLISPSLNLTGYTHTVLKFWHSQDLIYGSPNQDELRIYYKTSATGSWNLLATYTYQIWNWTQEVIELPNPSSDYYIAFEGDAKGGPGVNIDDVEVVGKNCSFTQATNFGFTPVSPSSINLSWTRGNGNEVLVVAREGNMVNIDPVNGKIYSADSIFGNGENVGYQAGNNGYAVYKGAGTHASILNLRPDIPYYFAIYEYSSEGCYETPGLTGNATISCADKWLLPFTENFDQVSGTFPPPCWAKYTGLNGLGTINEWNFDYSYTNEKSAAVYHESVTGGLAEDWLVSPNISLPSGPNFSLNFYEKQNSATNDGSQYHVKISTTSQTDRASFTDLINYDESTFGTSYTLRSIDLSPYAGKSVYIAFVMVQNDGDDWNIDNISIENTPQRTTAVWKGTTSTDWNTGSNWSNNNVPSIYNSISIPGGCPNYPILDETISCLSLSVHNGGMLIVAEGANLIISGHLAIGDGNSGTFRMNGGSCTISGNILTELGSNTTLAGGTISFTNWERNISSRWAVGNITLSGGTINASDYVYFSPKDLHGSMNGPFIFNVGNSFYISDSTWTTVIGGTINMLGNGLTSIGQVRGFFAPSNSTCNAIAYNLTIKIRSGYKFLIGSYGARKGLIIKNNFTMNRGRTMAGWARTIYVNGNLNIDTTGTLECSSDTTDFHLKGNFINKAGYMYFPAFTQSKGIFYLEGTDQIISGYNYFTNLTKIATSISTLYFDAGSANSTIIHGELKLQGSAGKILSLRSTQNGSQWEIDPQKTRILDFVDVKDSKNINVTSISACNLINSGNNTNWDLPPTLAGTISGNKTVCKGSSNVTYTVPGIEGATSYIWKLPTGATGSSTTNSISVSFGNTATSGDIKVKGHNSCGDGTESKLAITVNTVPSIAGTIAGNEMVCKGTSNVTYTVPDITGATSYVWSLPTGATGSSTTNSISVSFGNTATSGDIKVKGHNTCGDGTESKMAITVNTVPSIAGTITGNEMVCKGTSNVIYTVPDITGATSYLWTLPTGATGSSTTNSISVSFGNTATSGDIKVKGHNTCGDGTESELPLTVNAIPPTPVISLNNGILQSNATDGNQWYINNTIITNAVNTTLVPESKGDYSVIVTLNGCISQLSNIVSFNPTGVNDISSSDNIKVYPNPTSGLIKISLINSMESDYKIEVFNLTHIILTYSKQKNEKNIQIDLSNYPAGLYMIKISSKDLSYHSRVIKI